MMTGRAAELIDPLPHLSGASIGRARRTWRSGRPGPGAPLVLLHGIGSNARSWSEQFTSYDRQRAVVAWNAPGYAGSTALEPEWPTGDDYAAALLDVVDHLQLRAFVLVGHSLGAIMATAFAIHHPDRVLGLVLASPACGYGSTPYQDLPANVQVRLDALEALGPSAFAAERAERLLTPEASPRARRLVEDAMAEVAFDGYRQACRLLAASDLRSAVTRLPASPQVVWGGADRVTLPQACRSVASAAGVAGLELPGLGHAFASEAPDAFQAALAPILAATDKRLGARP